MKKALLLLLLSQVFGVKSFSQQGVGTHLAVVYAPSIRLAKMYENGTEVNLTNNGSNPITTAVAQNTNNLNKR